MTRKNGFVQKFFKCQIRGSRVYVEDAGAGNIRVMYPGDLLEITDKLSAKDLAIVKAKFYNHKMNDLIT